MDQVRGSGRWLWARKRPRPYRMVGLLVLQEVVGQAESGLAVLTIETDLEQSRFAARNTLWVSHRARGHHCKP